VKAVRYSDSTASLEVTPSLNDDNNAEVTLVMTEGCVECTVYLTAEEARELAADMIELADRADVLAGVKP
jgi:hypothetical protein